MRPPDDGGGGCPRLQREGLTDAEWWTFARLMFCVGLVLGVGFGIAVALGSGSFGLWLRDGVETAAPRRGTFWGVRPE